MAHRHPRDDRPAARYRSRYETGQDDPFRVPAQERAERRHRSRRRKDMRQAKRGRRGRRPEGEKDRGGERSDSLGRAAQLIVFGVLALVLAFSALRYSKAQAGLKTLRDERQAQIEAHEKELGYYVQMRRVSGFDEYIKNSAQEFQVDRSFISAVIARESHYDPKAESRVGARGLMQIMQDTGEWVSSRLALRPYSYELLFDPELNIRMGTWYLSYLSAQFGGDPVMIASAYHAGANNAKLWAMKHADDKRILRAEQIPAEDTRDYVRKVMNAYALFYEYDSSH